MTDITQTYLSLKTSNLPNLAIPIASDVMIVAQIEQFTSHSVIFDDNTTLTHIDTIMLATGHEYRIPYLTAGGQLTVMEPSSTYTDTNTRTLRTNLRYIWPLWRHMLPLDPAYPLGALYFINLGFPIISTFGSIVQGLFAAHTIRNPELLDSQEAFFADLKEQEARIRTKGYDPERHGHRVYLDQSLDAYQDGIMRYSQDRGLGGWPEIPPAGQNYTPPWPYATYDTAWTLKKGWDRWSGSG